MKNQPKRGKVPVRWNKPEMMEQLIAKGTVQGALREIAVNSFDAYADDEDFISEEIYVEILLEHGKFLRIVDWGEGMLSEDIQGFCDFMFSRKRNNPKKGGRVGSGRTHTFSFAKRIRVISRSKAFPGCVQFEFSKEDLMNEGCDVNYQYDVEPPSYFHLAAGETGTMIEILEIDWGKVKEKALLEELPTLFSWFAAKLLRFNGEPLKERPYQQEPLRSDKVVEQLGGLCRWDLFVPAAGTRTENYINLGARLVKITDLPRFLKGFPPELVRDQIPEVLRDGSVIGDILIPGLNKFRLHDSESLDAKVYEGFGYDMLALLREIGKEAEDYYRDFREETKRQKDREFVRKLTDKVNAVTGYNPDDVNRTIICTSPGTPQGKPGGVSPIARPPFLVNPRNLEIVKGFPVSTTISGYAKTSGLFSVKVEGKAVKVEKKSEREFLVTPVQLGDATLVYYETDRPAKEVRSTVRVVKAAGLQLTPLRAEIVQGGIGRVAIVHPEQLLNGKMPKFDHTAKKGYMKIFPRSRHKSASIEVDAKCPVGEVTISAVLAEIGLRAECVRTIVPRVEEDPPMLIEENLYHIEDDCGGQEALVMPMGDVFDKKLPLSLYKVKLCVDHKLLAGATELEKELLVVDSIVQIHMDLVHEALTGRERASRSDQIRTSILTGIRGQSAKSQKK